MRQAYPAQWRFDHRISVVEPHAQLDKRGKAGPPIPFGRQVLAFEDADGFLVHGVLINRDKGDQDAAVRATQARQTTFSDKVKRLSFDRGFQLPKNRTELSRLVDRP